MGKTGLVEGFAQRVIGCGLPEELRGTRVIEISLTALVAGTKYRGEFEERMEAVVQEASLEPKPILFIDEIHLLLGAGSASGIMDAANIPKPALATDSADEAGFKVLYGLVDAIMKANKCVPSSAS